MRNGWNWSAHEEWRRGPVLRPEPPAALAAGRGPRERAEADEAKDRAEGEGRGAAERRARRSRR